jgi:hypothetical protein
MRWHSKLTPVLPHSRRGRRGLDQGHRPRRDATVDDAISMLKFAKQRASGMVEKVIRSGVRQRQRA